MRKYKKIKVYLLLVGLAFVLSMLFCSNLLVNTGNRDNINNYQDESNLIGDHLQISKISGKIFINGTSDWVDFRNAGNCTGQGIYSDPYIIEDLVIDGGSSGSGIGIENSAVYFKIENCTVCNMGSYSGIKLNNVSNGQLIENNCSSNGIGIFLSNCIDNTLSGNEVNDNTNGGIILSTSSNNNIASNYIFRKYATIMSSESGISLTNSNNNTIITNTVIRHDFAGISMERSNYNIVSGNTVNDSYYSGIHLFFSNYSSIVENSVDNSSQDGLVLSDSNNNNISKNTIINTHSSGIRLINSNNNLVSGNTNLGYTINGIQLSLSNNNTISENTVYFNHAGIYLAISDYNTISGNTATNNSVGVHLYFSDYNVISSNTLTDSSFQCIWEEEDCDGNIFRNNKSCDYGEIDQGIPGYHIILLVGIAFIALLFSLRNRYKKGKVI